MKMTSIKKLLMSLTLIISILTMLAPVSESAQQYDGLCSYVKIEILQEMTLERIGFLATLEVTNNEGDASITDFSAALTFEREGEGGALEDVSDLFFVQPPKVRGVTAVDGQGIISPGQTAIVEWFIIPKLTAGGITPAGLQYLVGAELAGSIYGMEISQDVFTVLPDIITVKPDPELEITYFQPRDVDGDNPFTLDIVESPIPFTLGVLVKNVGYGAARNVQIASEQPRIVENEQGLLVIPKLLGARVDDQPTDNATLTVNLGNIEPGKCRKGAWDMITTLSGEFTEFKASYTHSLELGGEATSLIRSIDAYFIVHESINDQPGRDNLLDFLAETQGGEQLIPDTLYESDCVITPVNHLTTVSLFDYTGLEAIVDVTADIENWVFIRLDDPAQAKYDIESVVRSDGKVLNPNNYWTHIRYDEIDNSEITYLNIFDFVSLGNYRYRVTYAPPGSDADVPVTTLRFDGPVEDVGGTYYITHETQLFFTVEDASPVGTYYRLDAQGDFLPAYPFTIIESGAHELEYFSIDANNNEEQHVIVDVVVNDGYPVINDLQSDTGEIFIVGETISVRPTDLTLSFSSGNIPAGATGLLEIFEGVRAYPILGDVPSSPTLNNTATITVGGEMVDLYRYKVNSGPWSEERPVNSFINLSSLSDGPVTLTVNGRHQYGYYLPDEDALQVSWVVNSSAYAIAISGINEMPDRLTDASLSVIGPEFYCYRLDGNYYQPEPMSGGTITYSRLSEGEHLIEVLERSSLSDPCPGDVAGTTSLSWVVDRGYGHDLPPSALVYQENMGDVSVNPISVLWDGIDNGGAVVPIGWYTARITITDELGQVTTGIMPVQVGDMLPDTAILSDAGNADQKEVHSYGEWSVWQDQRNGNWDIYAMKLRDPNVQAVQVTSNALNQERPGTDGKYVVWEDRQADGTWDIMARELGSADAAFYITNTPDYDEKRPSVHYPWIIFQKKPTDDPTAPWQVSAYNMITDSETSIDVTTQDQLDPSVQSQRVVWQDFRDVGYGEIYMKDLRTGEVRRITDDTGGQYHPVVQDHWIVWSDNRNTQLDLYGYNLKRNTEVRLTNTPEDESMPYINGKWVIYEEDSAGELNINIRLLHLANMAVIQLTNIDSDKENPGMASGQLVWIDLRNGSRQVMAGSVPDLQPVFNNRNTVAVTEGMVSNQGDAYTLLGLWNEQAGVSEITRYTELLPQPVSDSVTWSGGAPSGNNFVLEAGGFLWVKFGNTNILDLGEGTCSSLALDIGVNVFSYSCFPDRYSAYRLIRELGTANVNGLRVLNSGTGRWEAASVVEGQIAGEDFDIPAVAVIMLEINTPVSQWVPGEVQ